ncbi:carboxypeptidase-like regulatory domain-containing protein [Pedobacter sp. UC225_65]|uniref:carboxypeptidase-like regulatory domain-containing protein n=1 Tax=Pedobacter sp. UC225_65 TaxID=3350173 RepID=UPI00366CA314
MGYGIYGKKLSLLKHLTNFYMPKLKISVPQPCTQQWAQMQPAKDGRFCSFCEKEVVDFRTWSMDELVDWFSKADQKVCGHFKSSQLDAVQKDEVRRRTWTFSSKIILASCLTLFTSTKVWSSTQSKSGHAIYEDKDSIKKKLSLEHLQDSIVINGKVKDSIGQTDLLGVKVFIKGTEQRVFTDWLGRFKIQTKRNQEVVLIFSYFGYLTKEIVILPEKTEDLKIELVTDGIVREPVILGGVVVITSRKPSFLKRMMNFIKNPF